METRCLLATRKEVGYWKGFRSLNNLIFFVLLTLCCNGCHSFLFPFETDLSSGFYCISGAAVINPDTMKCPVGKYCEKGTTEPTTCPEGTYR